MRPLRHRDDGARVSQTTARCEAHEVAVAAPGAQGAGDAAAPVPVLGLRTGAIGGRRWEGPAMSALKDAADTASRAMLAMRAYQQALEQVRDGEMLTNIVGAHHLMSERRTDLAMVLSELGELAERLGSPTVGLQHGRVKVGDFTLLLSLQVRLGVIGSAEVDEAVLVLARIQSVFHGGDLVRASVTCEVCGKAVQASTEESLAALAFARGFKSDLCGECVGLDQKARAERRSQALAALPGAMSWEG